MFTVLTLYLMRAAVFSARAKEYVSDVNKTYLRGLPRERAIRRSIDDLEVLFVHGSPSKINEYLFECVRQ